MERERAVEARRYNERRQRLALDDAYRRKRGAFAVDPFKNVRCAMLFEQLRKQWDGHGSRAPLHAALTFVDDWLVLGTGTRLALAKRGVCSPAIDDARVSALLCAAYQRPLEPRALGYIRRAIVTHGEGDATLALMHLAMTALWPLTQPKQAAYRLFMADALMKAGMTTRDVWHALGFDSALIERIEKYSPDQPRVPAGNGRPSGQWTRDGVGDLEAPALSSRSRAEHEGASDTASSIGSDTGSSDSRESTEFSVTLRQPSQPDQVLSDANPDPIKAGEQYAQIAIAKVPHTGDPRIDTTTDTLLETLAMIDAGIPRGVGPLYGTALHVAFANAVRALNLPGIGTEGVEQSFSLLDVAKYGAAGTIRTDVALWDDAQKNVIAIYDLKTGGATLSGGRVRDLMSRVPGGANAIVFEIRADRN
ncbi:MAG: hypothetical protein WAU78_01775 [Roseiarcus sp.]